jgi:hypothetical protein
VKHSGTTQFGHTDVYEIGSGIRTRLQSVRLRWALGYKPFNRRRTPDRWFRRWQAEHTVHQHLGATRAWTRTGALIAHERKVRRWLSREA